MSTQPLYMNDHRDQMSNVNIGKNERYVSLLAGIAMLITGLRRGGPGLLMAVLGIKLIYRGATGHSLIYQMMGVNTAVQTNKHAVSVPHKQGIHIVKSITINRPVEDLYNYWRNFENLPHFMQHLKSVKVIDNKRSHWIAKAPAGMKVEWDAEIINEVPNEVIGWRSLANSQIANAGSVRFMSTPGGHGTEIQVTLEYVPPAGNLGDVIAKWFGEAPEQQIADDLRQFKQLMEAGEITTIDSQTSNPPL